MKFSDLEKLAAPDDEVSFENDRLHGICSFCREPIRYAPSKLHGPDADGVIQFHVEKDGKLYHPSFRDHPSIAGCVPVALYAHYGCGPEGYWLSMDRMTKVEVCGEYGLMFHIETKF